MALIDGALAWFAGLPTPFAFLLALPFVIAFVALLKEAADQRRKRPH